MLTITIDENGKIYVGGSFTSYKSVTNNRIIRLNPNGNKDTDFDNTTGFNTNTVYAITIDENGKIYVGGGFTQWKAVTNNRIIRLNPNGDKDTGFVNTTGFNSGQVNSITIDENGKIYVGGTFTQYKSVTNNRIIRLNPNGDKDTDFDNTTGFSDNVNSIVIDENGKILIGGSFTTYKSVTNNRIIRLNPNGDKDTDFDNTTGFDSLVRPITIDENGKIYVGGDFNLYKSLAYNFLVKIYTYYQYNTFNKSLLQYADGYLDFYNDRTVPDWGNVKSRISRPEIITVAEETFLDGNEEVVIVNSSIGAITVHLPDDLTTGKKIIIKDNGNATTNNITVDGNGALIEGAATTPIDTDYGVLTLLYVVSLNTWVKI